MKKLLIKIVKKILPIKYRLAVRYFILRASNKLDDEMLYVTKLLQNKRRFLDIGANVGIYSFHFKNIFNNIEAFEPLEEITYRLKAIQSESVKVHNIALSNKNGKLNFFIPYENDKMNPALASLESRNGKCEVRTVKVNTVDYYNFNDVDLIKIDVEGHEQFVIEGAHNVIKRNMPILIVEIEQRHIKVNINVVFESILKLNYKGFFLQNGNLISLNKFSYELNQKPFLKNVMVREYINNFIFLPNHKKI